MLIFFLRAYCPLAAQDILKVRGKSTINFCSSGGWIWCCFFMWKGTMSTRLIKYDVQYSLVRFSEFEKCPCWLQIVCKSAVCLFWGKEIDTERVYFFSSGSWNHLEKTTIDLAKLPLQQQGWIPMRFKEVLLQFCSPKRISRHISISERAFASWFFSSIKRRIFFAVEMIYSRVKTDNRDMAYGE